MARLIIEIAGIHTSGKTTQCRLLENKGFRVMPEVAMELICMGYSSMEKATLDFDGEVLKLEVERYNNLPNSNIIFEETGYIGNFAHVLTRLALSKQGTVERECYERDRSLFEVAFKDHLKMFKPKVILYDVKDVNSIFDRSKLYDDSMTAEDREKALEFHSKVQYNLKMLLSKYFSSQEYLIIDSSASKDEVFKLTLDAIKSWS